MVQGVGYGLVQGVFVGVLEVVDGLLAVFLEKRDGTHGAEGSSLSQDVEMLGGVAVGVVVGVAEVVVGRVGVALSVVRGGQRGLHQGGCEGGSEEVLVGVVLGVLGGVAPGVLERVA